MKASGWLLSDGWGNIPFIAIARFVLDKAKYRAVKVPNGTDSYRTTSWSHNRKT